MRANSTEEFFSVLEIAMQGIRGGFSAHEKGRGGDTQSSFEGCARTARLVTKICCRSARGRPLLPEPLGAWDRFTKSLLPAKTLRSFQQKRPGAWPRPTKVAEACFKYARFTTGITDAGPPTRSVDSKRPYPRSDASVASPGHRQTYRA